MSAFSYVFSHRSLTLIHVPRFLREHGVRPAPILDEAGVSPWQLANPEAWFARDVCFLLEDRVARSTGMRFYGPHIASHYELPQLGWWGESISKAPNLLSALQFASQTIDTLQKGTRFTLVRKPKKLHLNFNYLGRGPIDPIQHIFATLVVIRKIGLIAGEPRATSVKLARPYSSMFSELNRFFGESIEFDCDADGIIFDSDILGVSLKKNPARETPFLETAHDAATLIAQMLPYARPTRERIAKRLQISERTLQRRLDDWGISFEELLYDYRKNQALRLLQRRDHSILEIAYSLGYSDPAHFTRAFRRWTNMSPIAYRTMVANGLGSNRH